MGGEGNVESAKANESVVKVESVGKDGMLVGGEGNVESSESNESVVKVESVGKDGAGYMVGFTGLG